MGDGAAGIGGQCHRRGDIRHDAEVEHEHMRRQQRDAHFNEDGGGDGGHDDIVGGGGYAHAQHNACQHGTEQRKEDALLGKGDNDRYQRGAQGGHGNNTGDDAGHGAGDRNEHKDDRGTQQAACCG